MSNPLNEVLTLNEATHLWGLGTSTLRRLIYDVEHGKSARLKPGEYRKAGREWLILKSAMIRLYGEPKEGK